MHENLRTKDCLVTGSLLGTDKNREDDYEPCRLDYTVKNLCGNKIVTLDLFHPDTCCSIITNAIQHHLQSKMTYDKSLRESNQLCILDKDLANLIFKRLEPIIKEEFSDVRPYGLDNEGPWTLDRINTCMRVNSYRAPSVGFKPHYDAAFCESHKVKSALSVVIYLNDSESHYAHIGNGSKIIGKFIGKFTGGELDFFDKRSKIDVPGVTVDEELHVNGGIHTYEKLKVMPVIGKCVIFNQRTLHSAAPVTEGIKYMIRTDVVFKKVAREKVDHDKNTTCNIPTIFTDFKYQKAANYFKEAQYHELIGDLKRANELYERNISVRKCEINISNDVWLYILQFIDLNCKITTSQINKYLNAVVKSDMSVFWKDVYHVSLQISSRHFNLCTDKYSQSQTLPLFVPFHNNRCGIRNTFRYHRKVNKLFHENIEAFLRVVAIYTIYLSGTAHTRHDVYIAQYDPKTKMALKCNLIWLLTCAYYEKICKGEFYIIDAKPQKKVLCTFDLANDRSNISNYDERCTKEHERNYLDENFLKDELDRFRLPEGQYCNSKKISDSDFDDVFKYSIEDNEERKIGLQVYKQKNLYIVSERCNFGDNCDDCWKIVEKEVDTMTYKNNLIFDFSNKKLMIEKCDIHTTNEKNMKYYSARINKLEVKPYFHASCNDLSTTFQFIEKRSTKLYKNRYIDKIHIELEETSDKTIYITTTYSCIESF